LISFVIPAHNEQLFIGDTLRILRASADELGDPFEIIVVDDASTDATAEVADALGATVKRIDRRQIAASRNAGAKIARGDLLIFVDADTHVPVETLRQALAAVRGGAVGGGARFRFESGPRWAHALGHVTVFLMRLLSWAAGCFVFARRDAFEAVGGFDERYYATEELVLSRALKRRGRMVIVREPVITSGRKQRHFTPREMWGQIAAILVGGRRVLKDRKALYFWYGDQR
jgi:cellulose synthase/poly-beta-1,6-N-acetylglucosamine synthase-like glycosyltransferase